MRLSSSQINRLRLIARALGRDAMPGEEYNRKGETRREELAAIRLRMLDEASTGTQYRAEAIEQNVETLLTDDGVKITAVAKWENVGNHIADYAACTTDQDDAEKLLALYQAVATLDAADLDAYSRHGRDALTADLVTADTTS